MFSTNAASNPTLPFLRNARRRQRTSSGEDVKPPKAKRQRSTLRRDGDYDISGVDQQADDGVNGLDSALEPSTLGLTGASAGFGDLPVRGPRKADKYSRTGISALLVSNSFLPCPNSGMYVTDTCASQANNDFYTVSHLPSLPEQLRQKSSGVCISGTELP